MKQLFLKSNILHIRTNEGEFEVSNPEVVGKWDGHHLLLFILNPPLRSASNNGLITTGDTCEWPGGVELIESCIKGSCAEANECIQPHYCVAKKLARLIPEEKKEFKPAQPTPNFPKGGMSFTESAYKEFETGGTDQWPNYAKNEKGTAVESSEPQEKGWQAVPAKKKPLSERLEDISRKIRERKATKIEEIELFEAYKLGKHENVSAPSESQEELLSEILGNWQDFISDPDNNSDFSSAKQQFMKAELEKFTIIETDKELSYDKIRSEYLKHRGRIWTKEEVMLKWIIENYKLITRNP